MDLIHADANLVEIGFVKEIDSFDAELSQETDAEIQANSFAMTVPDKAWENEPIEISHYIYSPDTEWGGCVEEIRHSTALKQITLSGVTWRGMLYRKIIEPPTGQDYKVITSTEANAAILELVGTSLGDVFVVSAADSGITVTRQFRYTNLLLGIETMLAEKGAALQIEFSQATKKVTLSARAIVDYSTTIDLSQDYGVDMVTTLGGFDRYNHIIALGAGELADRDIVHVYRNANGTMTTTPPAWVGTADDHATTYDYSNPETFAELQRGAEKRAKELEPYNMAELDPQVEGLTLLLGDIVGARDRLTGLSATVTIVGKILTMNTNGIKLETRVK